MGNKVNITAADINGLFSVPFSLLISREWNLNYLLVSALDQSKVNGFGVPFERSGVMVYDLDGTTARKIMKHKKIAPYIDKEEKEYVKDFEKGFWQMVSEKESKKIKNELKQSAINTLAKLQKVKRINVNLSIHDLNQIRFTASQLGIPYQNFISSLIHQYNAGKLIQKK